MARQKHTGCKFIKVGTAFPDAIMWTNNDTMPRVDAGNVFLTATGHVGATNVTNISQGEEGQVIFIVSSNPANATTIISGGALHLTANWVDGVDKTLTLIFVGAVWYEIARV